MKKNQYTFDPQYNTIWIVDPRRGNINAKETQIEKSLNLKILSTIIRNNRATNSKKSVWKEGDRFIFYPSSNKKPFYIEIDDRMRTTPLNFIIFDKSCSWIGLYPGTEIYYRVNDIENFQRDESVIKIESNTKILMKDLCIKPSGSLNELVNLPSVWMIVNKDSTITMDNCIIPWFDTIAIKVNKNVDLTIKSCTITGKGQTLIIENSSSTINFQNNVICSGTEVDYNDNTVGLFIENNNDDDDFQCVKLNCTQNNFVSAIYPIGACQEYLNYCNKNDNIIKNNVWIKFFPQLLKRMNIAIAGSQCNDEYVDANILKSTQAIFAHTHKLNILGPLNTYNTDNIKCWFCECILFNDYKRCVCVGEGWCEIFNRGVKPNGLYFAVCDKCYNLYK